MGESNRPDAAKSSRGAFRAVGDEAARHSRYSNVQPGLLGLPQLVAVVDPALALRLHRVPIHGIAHLVGNILYLVAATTELLDDPGTPAGAAHRDGVSDL